MNSWLLTVTLFIIQSYNQDHTILIHPDPAEIDRFSFGPTTIMENATFSIGCNFQAHPDPTWSIMNLNTGQTMMSADMSGDATLEQPRARCEDMGFWVCTGYNRLSHGKNVTRGANLTVLCEFCSALRCSALIFLFIYTTVFCFRCLLNYY